MSAGDDRDAVARGGCGTNVAEMAYAYRIPGCGCIVAAIIDDPHYAREVRKFKADTAMRGFTLAHLPVEEVRAMPWGWPCEHLKAAGTAAATSARSQATEKETP